MSVTIDCGEGRHEVCGGEGDQPHLIPQLAGETFKCSCPCHKSGEPRPAEDQTVELLAEWMLTRFGGSPPNLEFKARVQDDARDLLSDCNLVPRAWLQQDCRAHIQYQEELKAEAERLREALQEAEHALMDARNGLDLGLGCARDVEGDEEPVPFKSRSKMQADHLQRARAAHREVRQALGQHEQGGGS